MSLCLFVPEPLGSMTEERHSSAERGSGSVWWLHLRSSRVRESERRAVFVSGLMRSCDVDADGEGCEPWGAVGRAKR